MNVYEDSLYEHVSVKVELFITGASLCKCNHRHILAFIAFTAYTCQNLAHNVFHRL